MLTAILKLWPATERFTINRASLGRSALCGAGIIALLATVQPPDHKSTPLLLPTFQAQPQETPPPELLTVPADVDRGLALMEQGRRWEARSQLISALASHRDDFWGGRMQFVLGSMAIEEKNYAEALEHLRDPLILKSGLEDLSILYQGNAYYGLRNIERAAEAYRYFTATYPRGAFHGDAAKMLGESLVLLNRPAEAGAAFLDAANGITGWEAPSLHYKAADNYLRAGLLKEALPIYEEMYVEYPTYYRDSEIQAQIHKIRERLQLPLKIDPSVMEKRARKLNESGAHKSACNEYARIHSIYPSFFEQTGMALDMASEALKCENYSLARSLLSDALNRDSTGQADLLMGDLLWNTRKDPQPYLEKASTANTTYAESALFRLYQWKLAKGDNSGALQYMNELAGRFPGHNAGLALWKLAWTLYAAGSYAESSSLFSRYYQADPQGEYAAASLYWTARAKEKARKGDDVAELYQAVMTRFPRTIYGYLAADRMGTPTPEGDPPPANPATQRAAYFQSARSGMSVEIQRGWDHAELLRLCRLYPLALKELSFQESHAADKTPLLVKSATIFNDTRAHRLAIITLREAFPDYLTRPGSDLPRFIWEMMYPLRHDEIFKKNAERLGIEKNLLLGIACQESCFNPVAHSGSGAVGVLQLIPSTARLVARRYHIPYSSTYLTDPDKNIQLGSLYLDGLLRQFDRDVVYTLIGYNAGPGRVFSWKRKMPGLSGLELVENALFHETREYVLVVMQNAREYERLYGKS